MLFFVSHLANAIRRRLHTTGIKSKFIAASGAAAILGNGQTVHNLLNMGINMNPSMNPDWVREARKRVGKARLLLLDEISLVQPRMLTALDTGLRKLFEPNQPFGGLHVIALGDMYQLKVVGDTTFYEGAVRRATAKLISLSKALNPRLGEDTGIDLFTQFRRVDLVTQHRSTDEEHKKIIQMIRQPEVQYPLETCKIFELIGELTKEDVAKDAKDRIWQDATFVCKTNALRRMYNESGLRNFALRTHQPVLFWSCPSGTSPANLNTFRRKKGGEHLYNLEYETRGHFVRGMPCQITRNISVPDGIANGAPAVMVSVTTQNQTELKLPSLKGLVAGQMHPMSFPHSVNVVLKKDWDDAVRKKYKWCNEVKINHTSATLVDGSVKDIQVTQIEIDPNKLIALPHEAMHGKKRACWRSHQLTPGFAMTYHKIQGQTLEGGLVMVTESGKGPSLTLAQLYVALSRVKSLKRLRFMPMKEGKAKEMKLLEYPHAVKAWAGNYTKGLVELVVKGHPHIVHGECIKVNRIKGGAKELEVFSSWRSLSTNNEKTTHLKLCSATAVRSITSVEVEGDKHQCSATAALVPCSAGLWKHSGLRTDFYQAELSVLDKLSGYADFPTSKRTPNLTELRKLYSALYIRFNPKTDKRNHFIARLTPMWRMAMRRSKLMQTKWEKDAMKKETSPSDDLVGHVARHEWCPHCMLPSYDKFAEVNVCGHERKNKKRVKRFCGTSEVAGEKYKQVARQIERQLLAWAGDNRKTRKRKSRVPVNGTSTGDGEEATDTEEKTDGGVGSAKRTKTGVVDGSPATTGRSKRRRPDEDGGDRNKRSRFHPNAKKEVN